MTDYEKKVQLVQQLINSGATINQLNIENGFQQIINIDTPQDKKTPPEHPLTPYIRRGDKVTILLDWLHRAVDVQSQPKEQLAPIKAAMECRPQAISYTLPREVFNREFNLNISDDSWKDWIKSYHNKTYIHDDVDELKMYKEELAEIME